MNTKKENRQDQDVETDINEEFDDWQDALQKHEKRLKMIVTFSSDLEIPAGGFEIDLLNQQTDN